LLNSSDKQTEGSWHTIVDQLKDYADSRLINGCIYCGGREETRDHVPSRVFLDAPLPTNLPIVPACWACNNGFSRDEEYLACLIESVIAGSTNPDHIKRPRVADILRRNPALRSRIEAGKRGADGQIAFDIDRARIENVVLKLARGHAAYELSSSCRQEPSTLSWWPVSLMSEKERDSYEASHVTPLLGEIGSRRMQRLLVTQVTLESSMGQSSTLRLLVNDWIEVQDGRYRYLAADEAGAVRIKIVIGEYLACDVSWAD
jgi:hypothetical protein